MRKADVFPSIRFTLASIETLVVLYNQFTNLLLKSSSKRSNLSVVGNNTLKRLSVRREFRVVLQPPFDIRIAVTQAL